MARDPGSVWAPLPEAGAPDGYRKTQMIYHSTGGTGSARSIRDNWFGRSDVFVESTFIVGKHPGDPTLQMMDSTDHADANGRANQRAISVEVVCTGSEPWTDWQVAECIRLGRWARANHPILPRIIPSEPESGFGWHVMFGAPGPWTSAYGKVCPGRDAINQLKTRVFPAIFADTEPEDDMPLTNEDLQKVAGAVWNYDAGGEDGDQPAKHLLSQARTQAHSANAVAAGAMRAVDTLAAIVAKGQGVEVAELQKLVRQAVNDGIQDAGAAVRAAAEKPQPPVA